MAQADLCARIILAVVFMVAAVAKLADRRGSRDALRDFRLPEYAVMPTSQLLPISEVAVGVCLLISAAAWWAAIGAISLLLVFIAAIGVSMAHGRVPDCHCFGQLYSARAGWPTIFRNAILASFAAIVISAGRNASRLSPFAWLDRLNTAEISLTAGIIALGVVAIAQVWLTFGLLREHGRVLIRLDALESPDRNDHESSKKSASAALRNSYGNTTGLPIGTPAPVFDLPTQDGSRQSLIALCERGMPVMLVFSDPQCGPCRALLPDLTHWQQRHQGILTISMISRKSPSAGSAEEQKHELHNVLLDNDRKLNETYRVYGTPSAVIISPDGKIVSPVAAGPEAIRTLVERVITTGTKIVPVTQNGRSASVVSAEGLGLESRVPARDFLWKSLDERTISLSSLRGQSVILLFWNPSCGFCQRVLPDLRQWEAGSGDGKPHLVVISTGTVAENISLGLSSPIVLDEAFATGRALGITGTPSALWIDPQGRISGDVAAGGPAVLAKLNKREEVWT